jgi:hypothetical protein
LGLQGNGSSEHCNGEVIEQPSLTSSQSAPRFLQLFDALTARMTLGNLKR